MSKAQPPVASAAQELSPGLTQADPRIDRLAYAALITGVVSLVFNFFLIGPPSLVLGPSAAIMGYISRRRITNSHGNLRGGRIAFAGLIVGTIGFIVNAVWLFLIIVVFGPTFIERSRA
jgi:Domain of unknown function (DUF4190)